MQYEKINLTSVPFCGVPDFDKLENFIKTHNINVNIEKLKKNFTHNIIIIDDSNVNNKNGECIEIQDKNITEIHNLLLKYNYTLYKIHNEVENDAKQENYIYLPVIDK